MIDAFQVGDVLENKRVVDGNLTTDPLVHGVDESLVDGHALLGKGGGIVDRDVDQVRVRCPVFVQDQQQLLGPEIIQM